jgi:inosine-uridine nucleoside N-ribohydrolase
MLDQIKRQPGEITCWPWPADQRRRAAIQRDAATFGKLKQVAMMGGSVRSGYRKSQYVPSRPADKEYNIVSDIAARKSCSPPACRL